jgi:AcrR family transcriptional regulator
MGRPRLHNEQTGTALLDAAERIIDRDGVRSLSVRRLAEEVGTTTRAVYAVFGSKEALIVALGRRAFDWLATAIDAMPETIDPVADLAEAGVRVFRRLVTEHPALFKIGVQNTDVPPALAEGFRAAADSAMVTLHAKVERLRDAGLLDGRSVSDAACEFHALCEGLAALELRGVLRGRGEERIWRDALTALVAGFSARDTASLRAASRRSPRRPSRAL